MSTIHTPSAPPDTRLYAIGDIHGCVELLKRLLGKIAEDAAEHPTASKELIFLGDYIDRGLGSREVIDCLMRDIPAGFTPVYLRGNHEDILLRIMEGDLGMMPGWLQYGGLATLASYGIASGRSKAESNPEMIHAELQEKLPAAHLEFMQKTELSAMRGDYYFVHAGVRPGLSLELQTKEDMLWIRDAFLGSKNNFGKIIVHGHTISMEPEILPNRIGIDTGAYATGRLTCLVLAGTERGLIET